MMTKIVEIKPQCQVGRPPKCYTVMHSRYARSLVLFEQYLIGLSPGDVAK